MMTFFSLQNNKKEPQSINMNQLNMLALSFLLVISMTGTLAAPAMNMESK